MNILETLGKMKEACPVDCEVSISLIDEENIEGIQLLWVYSIGDIMRQRVAKISKSMLEDCILDPIEYQINKAKNNPNSWEPPKCEFIIKVKS